MHKRLAVIAAAALGLLAIPASASAAVPADIDLGDINVASGFNVVVHDVLNGLTVVLHEVLNGLSAF
jgi:hypothetical protein